MAEQVSLGNSVPPQKIMRALLQQAPPVIPVLVINSLDTVIPMAEALVRGGLNVLEVTLRSTIAWEAIELIQHHVPSALVGAGTVIHPNQLQQLVQHKVAFAVSPGITDELMTAANESHMPLLPGIANASQIMMGLEQGFNCFKFFPAAASGGVNALKSFYGPFDEVAFCPTGGISTQNCVSYLELPNVLCVGGSWVVPEYLVESANWGQIESLAADAASIHIKKASQF